MRPSAMRETIESVVVAFVLAFLFKTFEAEAFVIPTGSMAPTLLGRNKDVVCPKCGTHLTIGASDEVQPETDYVIPGAQDHLSRVSELPISNRRRPGLQRPRVQGRPHSGHEILL